MKMVRNKVIMTTEHGGFKNMIQLGFRLRPHKRKTQVQVWNHHNTRQKRDSTKWNLAGLAYDSGNLKAQSITL